MSVGVNIGSDRISASTSCRRTQRSVSSGPGRSVSVVTASFVIPSPHCTACTDWTLFATGCRRSNVGSFRLLSRMKSTLSATPRLDQNPYPHLNSQTKLNPNLKPHRDLSSKPNLNPNRPSRDIPKSLPPTRLARTHLGSQSRTLRKRSTVNWAEGWERTRRRPPQMRSSSPRLEGWGRSTFRMFRTGMNDTSQIAI